MIASSGSEVKIHEWPSGKLVSGIQLPSECQAANFRSVSWCTSGKQLLAIPPGSKPILLKSDDEESKRESFTSNVLDGPPEAGVGIFSRVSDDMASFGVATGEVFVMDICTKSVLKNFPCLPSSVLFLDYGYKDMALSAGCKNGQIFLYDTTGNVSASFFVPWSYSLSSMMFHPTREYLLAASSREGVLAIWDVNNSVAKFVVKCHTSPVCDIAISPSEELIASVGLDRKVNIHDLRSKEVIFSKIFSSELTAVACSPTGEDFAIGTSKGRIFALDKRRPFCPKASFSSQKSCIKCLSFDDNTINNKSIFKLEHALSNPVLADEESTSTPLSVVPSEAKTQASGDFSSNDDDSAISRIPGGMDDGLEKAATEQWLDRLSEEDCDDSKVPMMQLIDDANLTALKQELIKTSKQTMQRFMEDITTQFLKIRMGVSREFCLMESSNNKRWQEFNITLLKLAGFDETKKEPDIVSETLTSDDTELVGTKQGDSVYSRPKTKMTSFSQLKSTTMVNKN